MDGEGRATQEAKAEDEYRKYSVEIVGT